MSGVPLTTHTMMRNNIFNGLNDDIVQRATNNPRGRANTSVSANNSNVVKNPTANSPIISKNIALLFKLHMP